MLDLPPGNWRDIGAAVGAIAPDAGQGGAGQVRLGPWGACLVKRV